MKTLPSRSTAGPLRYLTILRWLPQYTRRQFVGDVVGGTTVAVMLVPQAMAYAVLAGVPPVLGLYASLLPLVVYSLTATSRHVALGVTAIDMIVVAAGVSVLATPGSDEYIRLVVVLSFMVGLAQIALGAFRLGFVVNLLSTPVVTGFTTAAALFIAASQVGTFVGVPMEIRGNSFLAIVAGIREVLPHAAALATVVGVASLLILLVLRWWSPRIPGALLVAAAGTLLAWLFGWRELGLPTVGEVPSGLPSLGLAAVGFSDLSDLAPTAATLAVIQLMTIMSLARVYAGRHGYSIRANRELVSVGAANLSSGLVGAPPVSGSLSRSAVGEQAGVQTPMANIVAAAVVLLTLMFVTPAFVNLPLAALAAVIIVAALSLVDVAEWRQLARTKAVDGILAAVTTVATLAIGLREGLVVGIIASVVAIMYRISRPNVAVLGRLPGTRSFRNVKRHPQAERQDDVLVIRIDASFSFANADFLRELLLGENGPVTDRTRAIIVDASSINDLDATATGVLKLVGNTLAERGVKLYFAGVKGPVEETMRRSGLYEQIGAEYFFLSPHRALEAFQASRPADLH